MLVVGDQQARDRRAAIADDDRAPLARAALRLEADREAIVRVLERGGLASLAHRADRHPLGDRRGLGLHEVESQRFEAVLQDAEVHRRFGFDHVGRVAERQPEGVPGDVHAGLARVGVGARGERGESESDCQGEGRSGSGQISWRPSLHGRGEHCPTLE